MLPRLVVMKFGGTSVADPVKIRRAAAKAVAARRAGARVAVVVSAPGEMTDELIDLAKAVSPAPDPRELDALMSVGEDMSAALFAMACRAQGATAVSLSGPQAGVRADGPRGHARLCAMEPRRLKRELAAGRIAVVCGFQGEDPAGDRMTLGRGGSDLSAVAVAAALEASCCEIFTDVKGVYTADPRVVSDARKLASVSYDEMLELSTAGAQVMLARSIELAKRRRVRVHVRSAFHAEPGTWIEDRKGGRMEKSLVTGLAAERGSALVRIDAPALRVLERLAEAEVPADMVVESAGGGVSFLTPREKAPAARRALAALGRASVDEDAVLLSAVGTGFIRHPGVAARMLAVLGRCGATPRAVSTSDLRVSCVVERRKAEEALKALHAAFKLGGSRV